MHLTRLEAGDHIDEFLVVYACHTSSTLIGSNTLA